MNNQRCPSHTQTKRTSGVLTTDDDETLPNFIERKHPRKGEKRKRGPRTKVRASKQPNKGGPQGGKGTTKN
jgi:hypothetical protein